MGRGAGSKVRFCNREKPMLKVVKEIRLAKYRKSVNWSCDRGESVEQVWCGAIAVVRRNCYGLTAASAMELAEIAKADFPGLKPEDCRIIHFGGVSYKGTFGIEFDCGDLAIAPDGWVEISELEYIL